MAGGWLQRKKAGGVHASGPVFGLDTEEADNKLLSSVASREKTLELPPREKTLELPPWATGFIQLDSASFSHPSGSGSVKRAQARAGRLTASLHAGLRHVAELRERSPLRQLGLRMIADSILDLHAELKSRGKSGLKREDVEACLKSLVCQAGSTCTLDDCLCIEQICTHIKLTEDKHFNIFESLALLPLFCGGEPEANDRVLFDFIDASKEGSLTLEQFQQFLTPCTAWCLQLCRHPTHEVELLAVQLARRIFKDVHAGNIDKITLADWLSWKQDHSFYHLVKDRLGTGPLLVRL